MQKYSDSVLNRNGDAIVGATVTVTQYPSGAVAALYSDNGSTPLSQPLTTDANGAFSFYVADGRYSISVTKFGIPAITISDVLIVDALALSIGGGGASEIADITGLQAALDSKEVAGEAASAVAAHAAALDPHPQYTTPTEAAAVAPVQTVAGRTGAVTLTKADVALSNVDNTSDASKPVSTAQATAIDAKMTNPMTTAGDVIIGGASGTPARLAAGTNGHVLTLSSGSPAWAAPTGGSGSSITLAATAWVEVGGNDGTGAAGDPSKPYATINAALDALSGSSAACIRLGIGTFAPITDDYLASAPTVPDPASKLRSNLTIIGTARPVLDSQTAPTQLINGSVIQGPLTFHSTRVNIELRNIGIDAGSAVCTALYGGADRSALEFFNIGQGAISPAHGIKVDNIICLTRTASAVAHCALFENLYKPQITNVQGYYGLHGVVFKTIGATIENIHSYGHSQDCIYFKDDSYARCYSNVAVNLCMGNMSGSDTPNGLFLTTGSTTALELLALSNVQCRGLSSYDIKADTISSGLTKNVRIDNMQSDNGAIRTSLTNVTQSSFYINNAPVNGVVALTDGATINTDAINGSGVFSVTPGAAGRTLANPTNLTIGQTYVWLITGGSGTITSYGTLFSFLPNATPTTSASAVVDVLTAVYDGTKLRAVYNKP